MTEHLASLTVTRSIEAVLGSDILGEYPRIDYQGTMGTLYAGSHAIYFAGMPSYLFLERQTEILSWQSVKQIQKVNDHAIEIIVANEVSLQEISHVFTIADHGLDRDKMWAFLMSLYNDALVDHAATTTSSNASSSSTPKRASPRAGSIIKRTNSDPLLQASPSTRAGRDQDETKSSEDTGLQSHSAATKRPSVTLTQAASIHLDQQLLALSLGDHIEATYGCNWRILQRRDELLECRVHIAA